MSALAEHLAPHYSRFRVTERLLLSGHSHQAWPDVALEGQVEAFEDAALHVDAKWERALAKADRVRDGFRALLSDPDAEIALASSTHDLVIRMLSALDLDARPRILTTDGEFHTLRRQLARMAEDGFDVERVPTRPADTLAERLAAALDDRTAVVFVSAVMFEDARIVSGLGALAQACAQRGAECVVDAYHALGAVPFTIAGQGLDTAWVLGGGYKYLQLGEGNCFMRLPAHAAVMRPTVTGWFAEFSALADEADPDAIAYGRGGDRFAGATYDPTSHYRAARVFDFFVEQGLTPELLRASYRYQVDLLARGFDALGLPDDVVTRDRETPLEAFGGFLALEAPQAGELQRALAERGVLTDSRGHHLRLGPAPYVSDAQIEAALQEFSAAVLVAR